MSRGPGYAEEISDISGVPRPVNKSMYRCRKKHEWSHLSAETGSEHCAWTTSIIASAAPSPPDAVRGCRRSRRHCARSGTPCRLPLATTPRRLAESERPMRRPS